MLFTQMIELYDLELLALVNEWIQLIPSYFDIRSTVSSKIKIGLLQILKRMDFLFFLLIYDNR